MVNTFFDSHCHFDFEAFADDRLQIWQQAQAQGVWGLLVPGVTPAQWPQARALSVQIPHCFYSVGLHPWWFERWLLQEKSVNTACNINYLQKIFIKLMAEFAGDNFCKAIGETGLDACMTGPNNTPLPIQQAIVTAHLHVANHFSLPVILHCRKAHNLLLACLDEVKPIAGGVLHGFTGSEQLAQNYWRRGLRIGVGGSITYERANKTRKAIQTLPNEALVLETDAPDMPLFGRQGQRNSPEYIPQIAQALAHLRGQALNDVAQYTFANTRALFDF